MFVTIFFQARLSSLSQTLHHTAVRCNQWKGSCESAPPLARLINVCREGDGEIASRSVTHASEEVTETNAFHHEWHFPHRKAWSGFAEGLWGRSNLQATVVEPNFTLVLWPFVHDVMRRRMCAAQHTFSQCIAYPLSAKCCTTLRDQVSFYGQMKRSTN